MDQDDLKTKVNGDGDTSDSLEKALWKEKVLKLLGASKQVLMRMVLNQCLEDINWTDLKKLKCINICAPSSVGIHDIIRRKCYIFLMKIQVFSEKSLSIMFTPWTNKIYSENYEVFNRFWQTFFFLKKKKLCAVITYCAWQDMSCANETYSEEPDLISVENAMKTMFLWFLDEVQHLGFWIVERNFLWD